MEGCMRAYHFFMKFWYSFRIGFRSGLIFLFCLGSVLAAMFLTGFPG